MAVSAVKKEPAKSQDAAAAGETAAPGVKKGRKLLKLLIILVIVAGMSGGGAYWYLNQNKGSKHAEAKPQPAKPPVYMPLEQFTVNLQLEDNPQFLQAGLSLKVSDIAVIDALKLHMPDVRDRILLLLSARKASELLTVEGKRQLGIDIVDTVNAILSPPAPKAKAKQPAKAPSETPPAEGEAAAAAAAEGEEKPEQEAAAPAPVPAPAPQLPILSVLFTSFIVQ